MAEQSLKRYSSMVEEIIMEGKRPFLVDVPVRVNIWIRPQCQRAQFEVLKKACPSIMILQSDGGRNEKEWAAIQQNRKLFDDEIDWNCHIYKLYEESNLGLYTMGGKVGKFIWDKFDRCIFLEDDYVPAVSFFQYCAELLERYKDDYRISRICGMNSLGTWDDAGSDYFFSKDGSIWGTATWRRVIEQRDNSFRYGKDPYVMGLLKKNTPSFIYKMIEGYANDSHYGGHVAGSEFWSFFNSYAYNQLQIIPRRNLICNIGYGEDSAHANGAKFKGSIPKMMNLPTYEMQFPMKHPTYFVADEEYALRMQRDLGQGSYGVRFSHKMKYYLNLIVHGQLGYIIKKSKNKIFGKRAMEN